MTTYLVDGDPEVRSSFAQAFRAAGLELRDLESPSHFLAECRAGAAGCLLLDHRSAGGDGLPLLDRLCGGRCPSPVILMVERGDVRTAVRAMRWGAHDVIEKPVVVIDELIEVVRAALAHDRRRVGQSTRGEDLGERFTRLTGRERELVPLICSGLSNKQIAARLRLSTKTVVNHRAHILSKVRASNTADLVRLAIGSGLAPSR